jgi:hypothetical protein
VTLRISTATLAVRGGAFIADITPVRTDSVFIYGIELRVTGLYGRFEIVTRPGFHSVTLSGGSPSAPGPTPQGELAGSPKRSTAKPAAPAAPRTSPPTRASPTAAFRGRSPAISTGACSIQPDAALQSNIPFLRGQAGGNLPNATVSPLYVVAPEPAGLRALSMRNVPSLTRPAVAGKHSRD